MNEIQNHVDRLLNSNISNYTKFSEGCSRKVFFYDNFVIKVPKIGLSGVKQNKIEKYIWDDTHNPLLNEVYIEYRNCIACKKLENNPDILMDLMGVYSTKQFEINLMQIYGNDIFPIIKKYNLEEIEIFKIDNWGYDYEFNSFKCLDYGYLNWRK